MIYILQTKPNLKKKKMDQFPQPVPFFRPCILTYRFLWSMIEFKQKKLNNFFAIKAEGDVTQEMLKCCCSNAEHEQMRMWTAKANLQDIILEIINWLLVSFWSAFYHLNFFFF